VLRQDLDAAGIPFRVETHDGPRYADFHVLRHSFLFALAAADVGPKEFQEFARHSDPRLTLGIYTYTRPEALAASVVRLQLSGDGPGNPFAGMTREQLETALAGVISVVVVLTGAGLFAPPLPPDLATGGESVEQGGNGTTGRPSVRGRRKSLKS
jgi:hypothetical protein